MSPKSYGPGMEYGPGTVSVLISFEFQISS